MVRSAGLLVIVTACGRIGYDPVDEQAYASCGEVRDTRADAADGIYLIAAGTGGSPIPAYCDLTGDGGGWMLVTRDMIVEERSRSVTVVETDDERGGLVVRVYANTGGCTDPIDNVHLVAFSDRPAWTQIRVRYRFAGATSCWWILGEVNTDPPSQVDGQVIAPNIAPFEPGVDTIREQVRMGGAAGDAFDGMPTRCDNDTTNFWHGNRGPDERSAVAILRRDVQPGPAGLATMTSCTEFAPGTSSPTWWEYSDISVR
jgi:hypothetical protein